MNTESISRSRPAVGDSKAERRHAFVTRWLPPRVLGPSRALADIVDNVARTRFFVLYGAWPAFQFCGCTGVLLAMALATTLVVKTGISGWAIGVIAAAAMATFLALAYATKIVTGEEQLIYYHHEIAITLVAALVAKALHQPVLPYVDITILGIGAFLACGRVGCLMVGCCHGRPFPWGVQYRDEHAREGFAPYLVGVRLFPIQAVESLWVLFVTMRGFIMVWDGLPAGTALAWYTMAYGAARFSFEFVRGDTDRPYTWGFSQGQWLSLWLMGAVLWAEWTGRISLQAWHSVVAMALLVWMAAVTVHRKLDRAQRFQLLHPYHVREVAGALERLSTHCQERNARQAEGMPVVCTSLGIWISGDRAGASVTIAEHYTLSQRGRVLSQAGARLLARLILELRHHPGPVQLLAGNRGTFHLVLPIGQGHGVAA